MEKDLEFEETEERGVREIINEGKIAVQYCFGQTAIWIPRRYCQTLGAERILGVVEKVFPVEELNRFGSYAIEQLRKGELAVECSNYNSYEIELPSLSKRRVFGKPPEIDSEERISKLVKLLNEELKK